MRVKEFNERNIKILERIVKGLSTKKFSIKRCCALQFYFEDGVKASVKEYYCDSVKDSSCWKEMHNDCSEEYISYYWGEFDDNETGLSYKITMFFKDFDHSSGNVHVLPGLIQFWEKSNNHEDFTIYISGKLVRSSDILPKDNYCKPDGPCKGGQTFGEPEWKPCVKRKFGKDFFNVPIVEELTSCIGKILSTDVCATRKADFLKGICKKATKSHELYDEIRDSIYEESGDLRKTTYSLLKWKQYDGGIKLLYSIVYLDNYGLFAVYGKKQHLVECKVNNGKSGVNYYVDGAEPESYYWKMIYKVFEKKGISHGEIFFEPKDKDL